jgi:hypothetical protein|tara:strand:+ start:36 stop:545 length:510 start_codon:yes stop_codon:yes gene_type:complete
MTRKLTQEEAEAKGLDAKYPAQLLEPYKGRMVKYKYRFLNCGHEWELSLNNLVTGRGCGACYLDLGPTYLYLLQHEGFKAFKIGITAVEHGRPWDSRIRQFEYKGWTLVHKVKFETRAEAEAAEQAVLYSWRYFPDGVRPEQMKDGYGETVSRVYVLPADVLAIMDKGD